MYNTSDIFLQPVSKELGNNLDGNISNDIGLKSDTFSRLSTLGIKEM